MKRASCQITELASLGMDLGVCIKEMDLRVVAQNDLCRKICGERVGSVCGEGCMSAYRFGGVNPDEQEGAEVRSSVNLHDGDAHDIVILNSLERITTLLYPLQRKHERLSAKLRAQGLSKREIEIMKLALDRWTNARIAKRLCISRATVRTHLNNIYKKMPEEEQRKVRPSLIS